MIKKIYTSYHFFAMLNTMCVEIKHYAERQYASINHYRQAV